MRRFLSILVATGAVTASFVVPAATAGGEHKNNTKWGKSGEVTQLCESEGGKVVYNGVLTLWPPNHKYNTGTITAIADNSEDTVTLTTEAAHDQVNEDGSEWNGAGNTPVEGDIKPTDGEPTESGTGSAAEEYLIRAERSGQRSALDSEGREGRHYVIGYEATFGDSDPCVGSFQIFVPHDMRPSNR